MTPTQHWLVWWNYVRCLGSLFYIQLFFHIEQKNIKYAISPLNLSYKIPDIFLALLKIYQFSWHFPEFLAKLFYFLTIPDIPHISDKVATLIYMYICILRMRCFRKAMTLPCTETKWKQLIIDNTKSNYSFHETETFDYKTFTFHNPIHVFPSEIVPSL